MLILKNEERGYTQTLGRSYHPGNLCVAGFTCPRLPRQSINGMRSDGLSGLEAQPHFMHKTPPLGPREVPECLLLDASIDGSFITTNSQ